MNVLHLAGTVSANSFALGPAPPLTDNPTFTVGNTTFVHHSCSAPISAEAALKTLRGFRTNGRRVVWCHSTELSRATGVDLRAWGRKFVDQGGAQMLVVYGAGSRELAIAARDAGLPIGRVIVCTDETTARNVLGDSIMDGDVLVALGTPLETCYKLAERLESRFERELLVTTVASK
jgi:hypothetical protein